MTGLWVTLAFLVGAAFGTFGTLWFFKRFLKRKAQKLAGNVFSGLINAKPKNEDNLDVTLVNTLRGEKVIKGLLSMWKG